MTQRCLLWVLIKSLCICFTPNFPLAHAQSEQKGTMAADSSLLPSLVEEYVSGLQDSKAKDTATGK